MRKGVLIGAVIGLVAVILGGAYAMKGDAPAPETLSPQIVEGFAGVDVGQPFTLTNHLGETVTQETYKGTYRLIYFGFTYCPDICPTELANISGALKELEAKGKADQITPLFISVDPERDTVAQMATYVGHFHPRLIGLTGTPEQVEEAKKIFKVYARKVKTDEMTDYTVDHSSFVYLVDPQDRLVAVFRKNTPSPELAALLEKFL